jgi:hypothetical protein
MASNAKPFLQALLEELLLLVALPPGHSQQSSDLQ